MKQQSKSFSIGQNRPELVKIGQKMFKWFMNFPLANSKAFPIPSFWAQEALKSKFTNWSFSLKNPIFAQKRAPNRAKLHNRSFVRINELIFCKQFNPCLAFVWPQIKANKKAKSGLDSCRFLDKMFYSGDGSVSCSSDFI